MSLDVLAATDWQAVSGPESASYHHAAVWPAMFSVAPVPVTLLTLRAVPVVVKVALSRALAVEQAESL